MQPLRAFICLTAVAILTAVALTGCGSSSDETTGSSTDTTPATTSGAPPGAKAKSCGGSPKGAKKIRATATTCLEGRGLASTWIDAENCTIPGGASRGSCRLVEWTCLSTVTGRGVAVSCSEPGKSVSFVARRSAARAG